MGKAEWGADPEFFGPRHAFRESLILAALPKAPSDGPHLECAAGVGSLALSLARAGRKVVAADLSVRSLAVLRRRITEAGLCGRIVPVAADITRLPFPDGAFASATTAETLEHVPEHGAGAAELARVLRPGGILAGTVPAGPGQWSDWDDWAGHLRRYTPGEMRRLLQGAGLDPRVETWGFPLVRLYDDLFLKRVNRRRLRSEAPVERDPALSRVQRLGRARWLVKLVRAAFSLDRLFTGSPRGVGLLFVARKPKG
jgi:SAM-dependent methyltransferase